MKKGVCSYRRRLPRLGFVTTLLLVGGYVVKAAEPEPGGVYVPAQSAIVARVGDGFFRSYMTTLSANTYPPAEHCVEHPNSCSESVRKGYSLVTFRFRIPELALVDEVIECVVDSDGKISRVSGVPDCVRDPRECTFSYDATVARTIARNAGLEPGEKPWALSFHWHSGFESYVWDVSNTLHESKYGGGGRSVLIDANDGRVLGVYGWDWIS